MQYFPALGGAHRAPRTLERSARRSDGAVGVDLVTFCDGRNHLSGSWIERFECTAGCRCPVLPINQQQFGLGKPDLERALTGVIICSVQKLQTALHAKAKAEAGYRFYALYDKISREDILAHAFAQCRSNKGAPGVDGQDFADIEKYGVERWLGELALALREESYQPDPIRRVFIPKANGKLRPLGISTVRDRVCMTA